MVAMKCIYVCTLLVAMKCISVVCLAARKNESLSTLAMTISCVYINGSNEIYICSMSCSQKDESHSTLTMTVSCVYMNGSNEMYVYLWYEDAEGGKGTEAVMVFGIF